MQQFPYPEHKEGQAGFDAKTIASWCICYGHLIFVINIVKRIVEEKANGSRVIFFSLNTGTFLNLIFLKIP